MEKEPTVYLYSFGHNLLSPPTNTSENLLQVQYEKEGELLKVRSQEHRGLVFSEMIAEIGN